MSFIITLDDTVELSTFCTVGNLLVYNTGFSPKIVRVPDHAQLPCLNSTTTTGSSELATAKI